MDGVAAVEEEADEPGADEAAAARHADEVAARRAAAVPGGRHLAPGVARRAKAPETQGERDTTRQRHRTLVEWLGRPLACCSD